MRAIKALLLTMALPAAALADEGMWTFNNFPAEKVKAKYGFSPTQEWLDHVRLSSVRIAGGCSASIVSADGLVMSNHHCAHACIQQLSTPKKDFVQAGFLAAAAKDEVKCPAMEINQLIDISDVTARVQNATKGIEEAKFNEVQRAELARIEKECATSNELRCDVVSLYRGGKYELYKYHRFQDVRLVFAPEFPIAFFGGDPDNFMFPRYDLDVSFLRLYGADGKPAKMEHYLKWSTENAKDGDMSFVAGNPGGTSRLLTAAQLQNDRDYKLVKSIGRLAELRGLLTEYQKRGAEQKRHSTEELFIIENSLKAIKGRQAALADAKFFDARVAAEKAFRAKIDADPNLKKQFGAVWDGIAAALEKGRALRAEYYGLEYSPPSDLFHHARALLRIGEELQKPNEQRLREYSDAKLPQLKAELLSEAPMYDEFEIVELTWGLTKMREELGPDHPVIKRVFGVKSPEDIAIEVVKGSKLKDLKVRKALFGDGKNAELIAASKDPLIAFAKSFDQEARAIRKRMEDEVEGPLKKQGELLAKAYFQIYGTSTYPDATFSPRLSYGAIKGYSENGREVKPLTSMAGAFDRHTGRDPFALPKSWLTSKAKLNLDTPMNLVSTNDIIGGNSGSPVVNKNAEVIGLVFDGNIQSLGGEYGFDENVNRCVAVHSAALIEALDKIYGAKRIVDELRPSSAAKAGAP